MRGLLLALVAAGGGLLSGGVAMPVEQLRAVPGLPAHLAGAFSEMSGCHLTKDGHFVVFDRREHAVFTVAPGAAKPRKIVQIGIERGRLLRPMAFDSAPDGTFVVADAPEGRSRIQFFLYQGAGLGAFTLSGPEPPQLTIGGVVVSGIASLEYTGRSVLISQPHVGHLVTEYGTDGRVLRTFGDLRPTGHEHDPQVHSALNTGFPLARSDGGYYYVFISGVPMFRRYAADGTLVFERHIQGVEVDPFLRTLPTTWARRGSGGDEQPIVQVSVRAAAVDHSDRLWISLAVPYTYVYDDDGDKVRALELRAAGVVSPTSFFFTHDKRVLVTPGCYAFPA